jgi:hypothetical protein
MDEENEDLKLDMLEVLLDMLLHIEGSIDDIETTGNEILKHVCRDAHVEYLERGDHDDTGIYKWRCDNISGTLITVIRFAYTVDRVTCGADDPVCELLTMLAGVETKHYSSDYNDSVDEAEYIIKSFLEPICRAKILRDDDPSDEPYSVVLNVYCNKKRYEIELEASTYDEVFDFEFDA